MELQTPGPSFLSVLTQVPQILGNRLEWMLDLQKKYGNVVRVPLGPRVNYAVFHPDYFRHILVANAKNYSKGRTFEKTSAYMGRGLATNEGTAWQVQRRRMSPHFSRDSLGKLSTIMIANIERMLNRWSSSAQRGEAIDLATEFQRLALETVARSLFGTGVPESEISEIIDAFKYALQFTTRRTMNPFDIPESLPLPSNIKFAKAVEQMDRTVYRMIREEVGRSEPSETLLSFLIHAEDPETGERMTEKQLRDEVMTLFLGGTDTSGNTLSWVFYNLHCLPEVKRRVLDEMKSVLGSRMPELGDLHQLGYLRRMTEETLRLYPQNWAMSRDAIGDDEVGGFKIPAGSTVFLGVYAAHRSPEFWDNPNVFDPDRFLPERAKGRHTLAYLPFGAGPRKCIGYQFALMEFSFTVSMILQRFDFELVNAKAITPHPVWSLWPKPGVLARLTEKA